MTPSHIRARPRFPQRVALTAGLAAALGLFQEGHAEIERAWTQATSQVLTLSESQNVVGQPVIRAVDNCADDGSQGTLRNEIEAAASGDTIDLSQLACSTITLGLPIHVTQDTLHLQGPFDHPLTISGGDQFPIFQHTGIGTLDINSLKIAHGYNFSTGLAKGGCIYSAANLALTSSEVSTCVLASASSRAFGAGIYTAGDLTLISSVITDNHVSTQNGDPQEIPTGGGAWVRGYLHAKYTTFSNNSAYQLNAVVPNGRGGGAYVFGSAQIESSTFSGNGADRCGAIKSIVTGPLVISNSTISGNNAIVKGGGICGAQGMTISNSTVAFNESPPASGYGSGISLLWVTNMTLESTIVANNIGASDIAGPGQSGVLGSNNLVTSSELPFFLSGTLQDCAKLDRLADNGGPTRTHAVLLGSRAIDHGSNDTNLNHDQRGGDRVAGPFADIGAFERQTGAVDERIFADDFQDSTDRDCNP